MILEICLSCSGVWISFWEGLFSFLSTSSGKTNFVACFCGLYSDYWLWCSRD